MKRSTLVTVLKFRIAKSLASIILIAVPMIICSILFIIKINAVPLVFILIIMFFLALLDKNRPDGTPSYQEQKIIRQKMLDDACQRALDKLK